MAHLPSIGDNMTLPVPIIVCHHCETEQKVEDTAEDSINGKNFRCLDCDEVIFSVSPHASPTPQVHLDIKSPF